MALEISRARATRRGRSHAKERAALLPRGARCAPTHLLDRDRRAHELAVDARVALQSHARDVRRADERAAVELESRAAVEPVAGDLPGAGAGGARLAERDDVADRRAAAAATSGGDDDDERERALSSNARFLEDDIGDTTTSATRALRRARAPRRRACSITLPTSAPNT